MVFFYSYVNKYGFFLFGRLLNFRNEKIILLFFDKFKVEVD